MSASLLFCFFVAFAAAALLTPLMRRMALRLGVVALPDPAVKTHTRAVPLLGGGAILAGMAPVLLACALHTARWAVVGAAIAIVAFLGAYKDFVRREVSPVPQLAIQVGAVVLLLSFIGPLRLTDNSSANVALSIVGCLWIINGWNFLDVMDGLAGGVAVVTAAFFAIGHLLIANTEGAMLSAALAGCMAGFLVYNYPPAIIFMGDSGSFPLGLLFCSLLLSGAPTTRASSITAFGLMLLLPMGEVAATSLRRILTGRSPLVGHTPDHLPLHLSQRGWSNGAVIWSAYLCAFLAGLMGLGTLVALDCAGIGFCQNSIPVNGAAQ